MAKKNHELSQPTFFDRILNFLNKTEIHFKVIEIESEDSSKYVPEVTHTKPSQEAKSLVLLGDGKPFIAMMGRLDKVDFKKLRGLTKTKDIKMATPEQVKEITGVEVGAVPPFGNLIGLPIYLNCCLSREMEIAFSAGLHTKVIIMNSNDFQKITNPIVGDFAKDYTPE
jgi:Ala-tRNA(Pro) deacylase